MAVEPAVEQNSPARNAALVAGAVGVVVAAVAAASLSANPNLYNCTERNTKCKKQNQTLGL